MTSSRPYLIRGIYDWIVDNNCTPYILVNAEAEGVEVPQDYVDDGKIVLNVSPASIRNLSLGNDWIEFDARFAGQPMQIMLPPSAVVAIYAKENGQGMLFSEDDGEEPPPEPGPGDGGGEGAESKKPNLKVIK